MSLLGQSGPASYAPKVTTPDGRPGVHRACEHCGKTYVARADRATSRSKFCSRDCRSTSRRGLPTAAAAKFISNGDDAKLKVRAHGLINKRVKDGMIVKPTACERCGRHASLDSCHVDYTRPHVVAWACRRCHMQSHFRPEVAEEIRRLARPRGPAPAFQPGPRRLYGSNGQEWRSIGEAARDLDVCNKAIFKAIDRPTPCKGVLISSVARK